MTRGVVGHRCAEVDQAGFTLLEVTVATALVVTILGATSVLVSSSLSIQAQEMDLYQLELEGLRIINRLSDEMRSIDPNSVLPLVLVDSTEIRYQRVTGFSGTTNQLSPACRIYLSKAPQAAVGEIVLEENGGQTSNVLVAGVVDLRFTAAGQGLEIFTVIGRIHDGILHTREVSQHISFRQ